MRRPKTTPKPPPRPGPRAAAVVYVRLTEEEHRELAEAAQREALPIGVWARSALLLTAREAGSRPTRPLR